MSGTKRLADLIARSSNLTLFSGAGMSTESGATSTIPNGAMKTS